jgi:hypothetical protein
VVLLVAVRALRVRGANRDDDALALSQDPVAPVEPQVQRAGHDFDVLGVQLVHVRAGEESPRAADDVELGVLAAGLVPRQPDLEPDAGSRKPRRRRSSDTTRDVLVGAKASGSDPNLRLRT